MNPPKVVVFDLGKVLVDFDYSIAARRIGSAGKMSFDEVQKYLSQSDLLIRYETGLISRREFFAEVCRVTGFGGTIEEFGTFFADIFTKIPEMVELHSAFRRKGFPTYIFSNTNDLAVAHIRSRFPFFSRFDGYVLSYEVRSMKPDAKIYEVVERETKCRGTDILYLDDRPENVAAGAMRGWRWILHETPQHTLSAIENFQLLK